MTYEEQQEMNAMREELATLRQNRRDNLIQQAQDSLIEKYRIDDRYELILDYMKDKVQVGDKETLSDIIPRAEAFLKNASKRAGLKIPMTSAEIFEAWNKERLAQEDSDRRAADELKQQML